MFDKGPRFIIDFHRSMLADDSRTEALRRAITAAVKPGDVVLDLGCGTGILSFFAVQAGARRVYAVEAGGVIELAKAVARSNGFVDRIRFVNQTSSHVELPEKVDLLVTETVGNFGLEEGILGSVIDARQRLLKEGAAIIPRSLELMVAPIEAPELYRGCDIWSDDLYQLDFSAARSFSVNNPQWVKLEPESLLSQPGCLARIDLAAVATDEVRGEVTFVAARPGRLHGIGGWFAAELAAGIVLSNAPPLETPSWSHGFFPLQDPMSIAEGDELHVAIHAAANGTVWRWQVEHRRGGAPCRRSARGRTGKADQSTFFGSFMSPAALRKLAGDHQPRLDQNGEIDHFVLGLMQGAMPLDAMARQLARRFPRRFPTPARGLERIRELSRRYSGS